MPHLLTYYRRRDTARFPSSIAATAKGTHAGFRQTESSADGCKQYLKHHGHVEWATVFVGEDEGIAGHLVSCEETL
jgi:hypothetical protein